MALIEENPQEVSPSDMVVAIPSFNEAETIAKHDGMCGPRPLGSLRRAREV